MMEPDVRDLARLDRGKRLGHAVEEGFDAHEPDVRMALGLGRQVLATPEAAF